MISGSLRPVLISAFAVLFGVAQILCACMSAQAAPVAQPMSQVSTTAQSQFGLFHSVLASHDVEAPMDHANDQHDHGGEHASDCTHCEGYSAVSQSGDGNLTVANLSHSLDKAVLPSALPNSGTRAKMSPSALAGLRWLDPPNETPISLKIRLQR